MYGKEMILTLKFIRHKITILNENVVDEDLLLIYY